MFSPLEQFTIINIVPLYLGQYNLSFTNSSLSLLLMFMSLFLITKASLNKIKLIPTRWQSFLELVYEFILSMVNDILGKDHKSQIFFPIIFTLFLFILFANLIGLIPYNLTPTSHIIVTFTLAFMIWIGVTIIGFLEHGTKFFGFFFPEGIPFFMAPFLVMIELLSYCSRPISLSVRLFANMMAGHTLFKILAGFSWSMLSMGGFIYFIGLLPIIFLVVLTGFEIGICIIQAYVFTILTVIYINDALHLH